MRVSTPDITLASVATSPERGDTSLPLPQPELDPDTLRSDLRDFLQELREAQRERVSGRKDVFVITQAYFHGFFCKPLLITDLEG